MRSFSLGLILSLGALLASSPRAAAQTFPADGDWNVIECLGGPSFDPLRDESGAVGERDVVGDASAPAFFGFADATHVFWRIRVDASPFEAGGFRPFSWGVEIDTDGMRMTYELLAQVDGVAGGDEVGLLRNTSTARVDDPSDPAEDVVMIWPATMAARAVEATGPFDSSFGDDPDFFVDLAIEKSVLMAEGVTDTTSIVLVFGTSSSGGRIDADLGCNDAGTDPRTLTGASTDVTTPEGTTGTDTDGDGLSDPEEGTLGTNPGQIDTDGDGFEDGVEVRAGTDPLDPNSFPTGLGVRGGGGPAGCSAAGAGASGSASLLLLGALALIRRRRRGTTARA